MDDTKVWPTRCASCAGRIFTGNITGYCAPCSARLDGTKGTLLEIQGERLVEARNVIDLLVGGEPGAVDAATDWLEADLP